MANLHVSDIVEFEQDGATNIGKIIEMLGDSVIISVVYPEYICAETITKRILDLKLVRKNEIHNNMDRIIRHGSRSSRWILS